MLWRRGIRVTQLLSKSLKWQVYWYFTNFYARFFKRLKLEYPQNETTRASRRFVKAMKPLEVSTISSRCWIWANTRQQIIPDNTKFGKNFLDLLRKIFIYDPEQRITAKEALNHPWFKEAATPDDGTEATKIRIQRDIAKEQASYLAEQNEYRWCA